VFIGIDIFTFEVLTKFRGCGVVVIKGDAYPRELDPNPAFVIVERWFDMAHSVVLFNFVDGELCAGDFAVIDRSTFILDLEETIIDFLFKILAFHKLLESV
jgi:hypothetical protein